MTFEEFKHKYKFTLEVLENENLSIMIGRVKRKDNNLTIAKLKYEVDIEGVREAEQNGSTLAFNNEIAKNTAKKMMLNHFALGFEITNFDTVNYPTIDDLFEV